jgi:thiamine pyrophosphate-dependent acetolactate synthase large subunit-like protein
VPRARGGRSTLTDTTHTHAEQPPVPATVDAPMAWWSDAVAELLRRFDIAHVSLNPGASFRGLHDSIVNHLGNERPGLVLCLHEEHAVALAHGYAKVTERPMAVALHTNVGLMHATMALFNAFCDRVPMLVIGATGPFDAARRRPWIEWIHTTADQGALIRPFVKWDDQPSSGPASLEALARANAITRTKPSAPVYVCLDAAVQETELPADGVELPDPARHPAPAPAGPLPEQAQQALELLASAERPLILMGRVSRDPQDWARRVALAESLGAAVLTDLKVGAAFPAPHPLNTAVPGTFLTDSGRELLAAADVVLSLDWVDLGGSLKQAHGTKPVTAKIISATQDHVLHNGWSKDHFELPPVDLAIACDPDLLVAALGQGIAAGSNAASERSAWPPAIPTDRGPATGSDPERTDAAAPEPTPDEIDIRMLASALRQELDDHDACLVRLPLSWHGADLWVQGPLDYLGQDGGAGLGSGPGMAVGAALALADSDRLAVAVLGDGDFLMGCQALWSAARYGLRLLVVVANNRSFFNDEVHQTRVARARERPVENRGVAIGVGDPDPDLGELARSLGLHGHGPITDPAELAGALSQGVAEALAGAAVVVDVRVNTLGYPGSANAARG